MDDGLKKEGTTVDALIARIASTDDARLTVDLLNEFTLIANQTPGFDHFRQNPAKNRYHGNIYLYDHTRVVLSNYPAGDYIHASYVSTNQQSRRFILTQAPLPETIPDFWHMVSQDQVQLIVAICQFDESATAATDDPFPVYWPQTADTTKAYGKVSVKCRSVKKVENAMTITYLEWKKEQSPVRLLVHLHLRAAGWETGGLPTRELMAFLDNVRLEESEMMKANGHPGLPPPMVVHCGSGTARSGQFTALAMATEAMQRGWPFSVKDIICSMQRQRYGVLREPVQVYALVYAIVEYAKKNNKIEAAPGNLDSVMNLIKEALSGRA